MNRVLVKTEGLYYVVDGKKHAGNCTGLRGNCTGLTGDCSGLWGNLDDAELTGADRKTGVKIDDLITAEATHA